MRFFWGLLFLTSCAGMQSDPSSVSLFSEIMNCGLNKSSNNNALQSNCKEKYKKEVHFVGDLRGIDKNNNSEQLFIKVDINDSGFGTPKRYLTCFTTPTKEQENLLRNTNIGSKIKVSGIAAKVHSSSGKGYYIQSIDIDDCIFSKILGR